MRVLIMECQIEWGLPVVMLGYSSLRLFFPQFRAHTCEVRGGHDAGRESRYLEKVFKKMLAVWNNEIK